MAPVMTKTNFMTETWPGVAEKMSKAFNFSPEEAAKLEQNKTAMLIAALPFLASCDNPERTALNHLSTYLVALNPACKAVFEHTPDDDSRSRRRLAEISHFHSGDPNVIERGMTLLELEMLSNYIKDQETDQEAAKYNPVVSGAWADYEDRKALLSEALDVISMPEMDEIMDIDFATRGWWRL